MIIHLIKDIDPSIQNNMASALEAIVIKKENTILVTGSKLKEIPAEFKPHVEDFFVMDTDMQLSSKKYLSEKRLIDLETVAFGGNTNNTVVIAGPCSVESEEQIRQTAELLVKNNIKILRAGSFKPRTSPYSFQGMGLEGLKLLAKIRDEYGLKIISEVRDSTHVDQVIEYADIVQIGAKSMYDHGILKTSGKCNKPVLLKRGFGTTLQEFVQASEFILSAGNEQVILCERGIRTFETKTRFTLDLCGVAFLKEHSNLPVIVDPSHAMGYSYGVSDLSRASAAMGVDGILIEVHPNPKVAKSDASQQLNHNEFENLLNTLHPIGKAVGYNII
jgi:3-deoxy-7-phosphoheptulonate synthase